MTTGVVRSDVAVKNVEDAMAAGLAVAGISTLGGVLVLAAAIPGTILLPVKGLLASGIVPP